MKIRPVPTIFLAATLLGGAALRSAADDIAEFYRGKRISFVIGFGTGGGYDIYARALGRFMGERIPGRPAIVMLNLPGAGSRRAAKTGFMQWPQRMVP